MKLNPVTLRTSHRGCIGEVRKTVDVAVIRKNFCVQSISKIFLQIVQSAVITGVTVIIM